MSSSLPSADASVAAGLTLDLRASAQANLQAAVQFARLADVITTQHLESQQMSQQLLDAVNKSNAATQKFIADASAFRADVREALGRLKNAPSIVTEDPDVAAAITQLDTATAAVGEANAAIVQDDDALGVNGFKEFTITDPIVGAAGTPAGSATAAVVGDVSTSAAASTTVDTSIGSSVGVGTETSVGTVANLAPIGAAPVSSEDAIASIASAPAVVPASPSPSEIAAAESAAARSAQG